MSRQSSFNIVLSIDSTFSITKSLELHWRDRTPFFQ
uniref:Uncharacterized protein n=1 Tax=Anguilla anguilla TaxID=7936 RepID=A0A0E9UN79_ANGAN